MPKDYAQALFKAAHSEGSEKVDPKALVAHLKAALEKQGRVKLLPAILRELQQLEARQEKLAPLVEVAHASDSAHALKSAAEFGIHTEHAHVNASLIKGWRATGNGKLVDHSAKRSLIELYRSITT